MTDARNRLLLFERYPALEGRLPWVRLGSGPSPVLPMRKLEEFAGSGRLFVKRDDSFGRPGGGKLRKLEFLLADARERRRTTVLTFGPAGSNHVVATTTWAAALGMQTLGILIPQTVQPYVVPNLAYSLSQGCSLEFVPRQELAPLAAVRRYLSQTFRAGRRPYIILPGGTSPLGILGYVEAGLELAQQVADEELPEPDFVFIPAGTCGSLAGLALGLKLSGLRSTAVGVRVFSRITSNEHATAWLANRTWRFLRRRAPNLPNVRLRARDIAMIHHHFGGGYAAFTDAGTRAVEQARDKEDLTLEGTYTGKALAAMMEFMADPAHSSRTGVLVNTHGPARHDGTADIEALEPRLREWLKAQTGTSP